MAKFIIQGSQSLKGVIRLGGAKNASFKLMIASLLTKGETRLLNFSRIADVKITKKILQSIGAKVGKRGERTLFIETSCLTNSKIPKKLGLASRASTMFIGPLLTRFKKVVVPLPGGDQLGKRPLDRHLAGLKALGAKVVFNNDWLEVSCQGLKGANYCFSKNSHTGTETLIMAAVKAKGKTVLENAAQEPEVDDLIAFLNKMGAKIKRKGERIIEIKGVKELKPVIYQIMPDRNEAVSYAIAAIATKGDIIVENAQAGHLQAFLNKLKASGGEYEVGNYGIRFYYKKPLQAVDITTRPHPGFMTDWQPLWSVLATQAEGVSKIIETVHLNRFQYVPFLQQMGAKIDFFQPSVDNPDKFYNFNLEDDRPDFYHGIRIKGPAKLKAAQAKVLNLRAGATLTIAGLIAQGKTVLTDIDHIDRGYEDLDSRLVELGAKIKRVRG